MKYAVLFAALCASNAAFAQDAEQPKSFTLDGELGLSLTTGNVENSLLRARLNAKHELKSWSNEYLFEGNYAERTVDVTEVNDAGETVIIGEENETFKQRFFFSAQGNYKLDNPENRLFVFSSYEDNRFTNFKYTGTLAAGWSSVWFDTEKHNFTYSIGPGYTFIERQNGESLDSVVVRGSFDYSWKLSDTARFEQLLSTEVGENNTRSRSESSISAKLMDALSMKFSVILDHNTDVEDGFENLDTQTSATLVYTFF